MLQLASLGLYEVEKHTGNPDDERMELRYTSDHSLVAWFQSTTRVSDGERILRTNAEFVVRESMSREQIAAAQGWLDGHAHPASLHLEVRVPAVAA
jgi:hypothetical protein